MLIDLCHDCHGGSEMLYVFPNNFKHTHMTTHSKQKNVLSLQQSFCLQLDSSLCGANTSLLISQWSLIKE